MRLSFKAPGSTAPTVFTFVNAHLAAFDEMVDKRNLDFQDLSKRLVFEVTWPPEEEHDLGYSLPTLTAYESDVLFWMVSISVVWISRMAVTIVRHRAVWVAPPRSCGSRR